MTSENENSSYSPLKENIFPINEKKSQKWNAFVLILSLILGAEVIITAILLYDLSKEISKAQEVGRLGAYPLHCLQQLVESEDRENASLVSRDLSSCDVWTQELIRSGHKLLVSDIRNALYKELTDSNVTLSLSNKPAIHMGAEQELRQFPDWMRKSGEENVIRATVNLRWDNSNGAALQQGFMGYSEDGEIVVPRDGLYFVYSQVYFQVPLSARTERLHHYLQYMYRKTALYQQPVLLSKAAVTRCWSPGQHVQLYSSHQGALFHLQQGDRLSLQVADVQSVRLQEDSTFFGAFMIN